jgi:hypothetical protein
VKLFALLPPNRSEPGSLWAQDATTIVWGPVRCLGKADNAHAAKAGNPTRDPVKLEGDTPTGAYRITGVVREPHPPETYGPAFIRLSPVSGPALEGWKNGRRGLGIHGGTLRDGALRPTFGCLRADDDAVDQVASLLDLQLAQIGEAYLQVDEQATSTETA